MTDEPRPPRVFDLDDPRLQGAVEASSARPNSVQPASAQPGTETPAASAHTHPTAPRRHRFSLPTLTGVSSGIRVGALFLSAVVALATLAATVSFMNFVQVAVARDDWIGWIAAGLLGLVAATGLILIGREIIGFMRLARLGRLRRDLAAALADRDVKAERAGLVRLQSLYAARPDLRLALDRLAEHQRDVHDPGGLLRIGERELMTPLDQQARRMVWRSAKRVATVSALSPMALITVGYVATENIGLLRRLAGLYGGRPGTLGSLQLARLVVGHLVGTGGVAMTDDLLGQFLGQDLLRRLSARLGEGAFNAALTARLGAAAIEVVRPLAYIEATPVRARDILTEWFGAEPDPKPSKDPAKPTG